MRRCLLEYEGFFYKFELAYKSVAALTIARMYFILSLYCFSNQKQDCMHQSEPAARLLDTDGV